LANIKSQIKRIGTNKKSQDRNKAVKSEVKTAVRSAREAIVAGDAAKAATARACVEEARQGRKPRGVIHKNQAANRKSAIAKQVAHSEHCSPGPSPFAAASGGFCVRSVACRICRVSGLSEGRRAKLTDEDGAASRTSGARVRIGDDGDRDH
jgi:small subunit ribosomal protein S20